MMSVILRIVEAGDAKRIPELWKQRSVARQSVTKGDSEETRLCTSTVMYTTILKDVVGQACPGSLRHAWSRGAPS